MNTKVRHCTAALAMICLAGCANQPRYLAQRSRHQPVTFSITNNNWLDASIYAVSNAYRVHLGTVVTGSRQRFMLPKSMNSTPGLRLEIRLVGSRETFQSELFQVYPGDSVEWRVENQLSLSTYRIASS